MRCVVSRHLISSWERGFKIFLRLYIPPEARQRATAHLSDLWCHSAFFVCGATLMHLNKIFPFTSGESLLGLIDELLADFCNRDLFTYYVAHKCISFLSKSVAAYKFQPLWSFLHSPNGQILKESLLWIPATLDACHYIEVQCLCTVSIAIY